MNFNCLYNLSLERKIIISKYILKKFSSNKPYHLAFSGGKDSIVLAHLCSSTPVPAVLHFYDNELNHHSIRKFILDNYQNVVFHKNSISFINLCIKKKLLPTRNKRFCCEFLKECYFADFNENIVITGVRVDESNSRKKTMLTSCFYHRNICKLKESINPIYFWSDDDVWGYIKKFNLPYPELYNLINRIGCIGCPMSYNKRKELLLFFPKYKIIWLKACRKLIKLGINTKFSTPEDYLNWYLSDLSIRDYFELKKQGLLFHLDNL